MGLVRLIDYRCRLIGHCVFGSSVEVASQMML